MQLCFAVKLSAMTEFLLLGEVILEGRQEKRKKCVRIALRYKKKTHEGCP